MRAALTILAFRLVAAVHAPVAVVDEDPIVFRAKNLNQCITGKKTQDHQFGSDPVRATGVRFYSKGGSRVTT